MRGDHKDFTVPVHQADATLSQANPTSGTKYTVLDTTKNVRIRGISVKVTWTVQPTPLEIHITIDGQTRTHTFTNPVTATNYICDEYDYSDPTALPMDITARLTQRDMLIEGRSVKVEAEITGGTVSNLSARVKYAKW